MRKLYVRLALVPLLASMVQFAAAQLYCTPALFFPNHPPGYPETVSVVDLNGAHVNFKYAGVQPAEKGIPNFIIVIPSSGITPAAVQIALNPNVVALLS
jgi:hypothetical protein